MNTELTTELAGEIARLHELAEAKANDAKCQMGEALQAAVQCGGLVEQVRGMTKGQLLGWLRDNVPDLTPQRAKAYMSLYHVAEERGIENVDHRQLLLLGVIDAKEASATPSAKTDIGAGKWIKWAGGIRGWFTKETASRPLEQWTADERDQVRNQLEPIVEIWRKLQ